MRRHGAQRQPEDRARLLLELGRRRALDRPVARVVDPRRELVDHQPAAAQLEQLDGQQPDEVEAAREPLGDLGGVERLERIDRRRRDALGQDPGVVDVARRREGAGPPVAVAGEDHRQLGLEVDLRLEQQRPAVLAAQRADRGRDLGTRTDPRLAPPVVAAERQLEPARVAERVRGGLGVVDPAHLAPRRHVLADGADEPALREPVLGRPERRQPGPQRGVLPGGRGGIEAHVLQLVRDDVAALAQPARGVDVVIAARRSARPRRPRSGRPGPGRARRSGSPSPAPRSRASGRAGRRP